MFHYSNHVWYCIFVGHCFSWLQASVDYAKQTWSLYVPTTSTHVHGATSASGSTQPIKSTLQTPTLCNEAPGETSGHGAPPFCHTNIYNSPPAAGGCIIPIDNQKQIPKVRLHFKQIPGCRIRMFWTLRYTCVVKNPLCWCNYKCLGWIS